MPRVVLDTVVYNRAIEYPEFGQALWQACQLGHFKVISTHVQRDQLAATPDVQKREALLAFFDAVSPELTSTAAAVWDVSKWDQSEFGDTKGLQFFEQALGATTSGHRGHASDALLAVTAFAKADMFVTADAGLLRRTRKAVLQCGASLAVMDYDDFKTELGVKP